MGELKRLIDGKLVEGAGLQLQSALEGEREEILAELEAEVGCPVLLTNGPQLVPQTSRAQ